MNRLGLILWIGCGFAATVSVGADPRVWTDVTGRFKIEAELVAVEGGTVTLRKPDGSEVAVPTSKLSQADLRFLKEHNSHPPERIPDRRPRARGREDSASAGEIRGAAEEFFADLRTEGRARATGLLTGDARKLVADGKSPLQGLPKPDDHTRAIRAGQAEIKGEVGVVPVRVRAGGAFYKTKLHFRRDAEAWRVFAISAEFPDGEKTIDFEAAPSDGKQDPLLALIGKELSVQGVTLQGRPLDWEQFDGKVVLVDFWATWCGPCRAEMPNIRQNYAKHHDAGFEVVAISVDRDMNALKQFVIEEKPPWTVVADRHPAARESMAARLGISGIPAFVLIGRDGKVAAVHCRGERLGVELKKLLGEPSDRVASRL
ncbi:redoxin family protein [Posidoniimonas corsicana]|nr:redoxin family protein [Posidoniimonas corsicana]